MLTTSDYIDGRDDFTVYVPGVVSVIAKADDPTIEDTRPIGGYCSTETLDRQQEVVVAQGLNFDEFVAHGFFNDNHKQDTAAVLGAPRLAELRGNRWWTEGNLIKGYPQADKVWALAKALRDNPAVDRKLGFSIEGSVTTRGAGNRILSAKVRHVAITNSPVNTECCRGHSDSR